MFQVVCFAASPKPVEDTLIIEPRAGVCGTRLAIAAQEPDTLVGGMDREVPRRTVTELTNLFALMHMKLFGNSSLRLHGRLSSSSVLRLFLGSTWELLTNIAHPTDAT